VDLGEDAAKLGRVQGITGSNSLLLVRAAFAGDDALQHVSDEAQRENEDVSGHTLSPSATRRWMVIAGCGEPFRCIPTELWSIGNNLNIAHPSWEDFTGAIDRGSVSRGFGK
jgi:hypothetical protein